MRTVHLFLTNVYWRYRDWRHYHAPIFVSLRHMNRWNR
jgi:hypothetical protein